MDAHFRAFTFVDRITELDPGRQIRGRYTIPVDVPNFPATLVTEAVGQLAAWAAMAALEFKSRPVAGLATHIDFLTSVQPGQVLELSAELETLEEDAVAYHGNAQVDGRPVIALRDCVGPMLPLEQFDDPHAIRERFELLRHHGALPGAWGNVTNLALDNVGGQHGESAHATLHVPNQAPFFADHFPRRPVLPGTLLMNSNLELVASLAATLPASAGRRWVLRRVSDVKLRTFTPPGGTLQIEAKLTQLSADAASVSLETREGKRMIASARVRLEYA